ncbi:MAG: helix-turn-helix domain-containing protein [Myxococcota bacterium]
MTGTGDEELLASERYVQLIKELRREHEGEWGFQTKMARRLGISAGYFNKLLHGGRTGVGLDTIARAAVRMRILPHYFLEADGSYRDFVVETTGELARRSRPLTETGGFSADLARSICDGVVITARRNRAEAATTPAASGATLPPEFRGDAVDGVLMKMVTALLAESGGMVLEPPGIDEWLGSPEATGLTKREKSVARGLGWVASRLGYLPTPFLYSNLVSALRMLPEVDDSETE